MIVREAKLINGTKEQYQALDDAIRTAQFIRNKAVRYWMDSQKVGKADLYKLCKDLAKEFAFALKLNSAARQASAERAWASISNFYNRCKKQEKRKGYPKFKKHCRSVEYKVSGWVRFVSSKNRELKLEVYEEQEVNRSYWLKQNS